MPDPVRDRSRPDHPTADPSAAGRTGDFTGGATVDPDPAATADPGGPAGEAPVPAGPGRYELGDEIARGGMGVVYRARDLALGRDVAVKVVGGRLGASPAAARRFLAEAHVTAQLQHPGIPPVHDLGTLPDGRPFLAMKLIEGQTLDQLLAHPDRARGGGRTPSLTLGVRQEDAARLPNFLAAFEQVCQAVAYAHAHGVVHRDLKPQNVMVGSFGEVQVMDWGLAKVLAGGRRQPPASPDDPDETALLNPRPAIRIADSDDTQAGSVLGTPAYMPPEQAIGAIDQVDERSDVFGLGAVLCAVLTGRPPYRGDSAESTRQLAARAKLDDAFGRLDASGADPELVALCRRCLSAEKADRPADAGEVAVAVADLRAAADDRARQAELDRTRAEAEARGQARRRRVVQWAAGAVAGVLLLGVGGTTAGLVRADAARRDAEAAERATEAKRVEAVAAREAEAAERAKAEAAQKAEADQRAVAQAKQAEAVAAREKEAAERKKAEAAKVLAEAKEKEATATVRFFEDKVFAAARPKGQDGGLGKDVTLQAALVASLPALAKGFGDQPLVEAQLRMSVGKTFYHLSEFNLAVQQYDRARAIYTERLGPDHRNTLRSMHNQATMYLELTQPAAAAKLHEAVLAAQRRVLPPDHPDTIESMNGLATSYTYIKGRPRDALRLREEVLAAYRRVLPPDHPDTFRAMANLADSYRLADRHADAITLMEEVLAGFKRVLPPDHPNTLKSMHLLANSYTRTGRLEESVRLHEEAVGRQRVVLGPDHLDTLRSMNDLAITYRVAGRHPDHLRVVDDFLAVAPKARADPDWVGGVCGWRMDHFRRAGDPDGCRATAELWEKLGYRTARSRYDAARFRAAAAGEYAKAGRPAEETADAGKAVEWLKTVVAGRYGDRVKLEKDKDLDPLRGRADFKALVGSLPDLAPPPRPVRAGG